MDKISNIELIPVIELEPLDFSDGRCYNGPNDIENHLELWDEYNRKSYADAGLTSITPIETGSWLFKIENLNENELAIIMKRKLETSGEDHDSINEIFNDPVEYVPLIAGGYLFLSMHNILSKPGCCSGLEDIEDWKNASNGTLGEIWTGHDKDGIVHLSNFMYDSIYQMTIDDNFMLIDILELQNAVKKAEHKIDTFIQQTGVIINQSFDIKNGHEISKSMIYK